MIAQEASVVESSSEPPPTVRLSGQAVRQPSRAFWLGLSSLLLLCIAAGLLVGRGGANTALDPVYLGMRTHRVIVALLCGASLSVSGVVVQALFHNPLASPWILGTSSGATLGAHVAMLATVLFLSGGSVWGLAPEMMVPLGAVLGAALSLFVLLSVVSFRSGPLTLLLTGFALMAIFQGCSTFLSNLYQEAWELNRALAALQNGNIASVGIKQVELAVVMLLGGTAPIFFFAPTLDVLLSGDEEATSLGIDVPRVRFWLVCWVAVCTAGAVAVGGSVGMVGLVVPHMLRPWVGHLHRHLLPASFLAGGAFIILCDVVCRVVPVRLELPLGVLVDLIGAPVFLWLLIRLSRGQLNHA
jgi:iron complex transport system permease protein